MKLPIPRKHCGLIEKWANDSSIKIEGRSKGQINWSPIRYPSWSEEMEYRIAKTDDQIAIEALKDIVHATTSNSRSGYLARKALRRIEENSPNA